MGFFKKKVDPISDRARALTEEIAALEAQIKRLDSKLNSGTPAPAPAPAPRLRSTALPHGASTVVHSAPPPPAAAKPSEPIFEEVDQNRLKDREETAANGHYNDLGVRKYDLAAVLRRWKNHFRGPPTTNPKLVNYLAAGSIQGLRPMRYEKRVARNRFLGLFIVVLLILIGIVAAVIRRH